MNIDEYTCPNCSSTEVISPSAEKCPACHRTLPAPPNVRAALDCREIEALQERLNTARDEASLRGCSENLRSFEDNTKHAQAVICRPAVEIGRLLHSGQLYNTFYQQVDGNSRLPNGDFDTIRLQADAFVFPHYSKQIVFGALALNKIGPESYGAHSITLKEEMISHRATVFETNTTVFCDKHGISISKSIPKGYRATWENKSDLAVSKLSSKITEETTKEEHPQLLLENNGKTDADEFIEVNIFGGFSRSAISSINFGTPINRADKLLIKQYTEQAESHGINVTSSKKQESEAA